MEATSPNHIPRAKISLPRPLAHLCLFFHPHLRSAPRGECSHFEHTAAPPAPPRSLSLPPELDLSSMANLSTPPERLVDSVLSLNRFLLIGDELLGPNNLNIVGPHPVDGGGIAEIWLCERNDGKNVVIKSYRHYSSSSRLPTFWVSITPPWANCQFYLLRPVDRGFTRKRLFAII